MPDRNETPENSVPVISDSTEGRTTPSRNEQLGNAKSAKQDEFYTQYEDIQAEINAYLEYNLDTFRDKTVLLPCDDPEWSNFTKFFAQNFERLGLKKLISTSYATESKNTNAEGYQFTIFDFLTDYEKNSPQYDENRTTSHGKIFTLTRRHKKKIDIDDLEWKYLEGDGDFQSDEVKALRDESDIIITNPPFSKFRLFLSWIMESNKKFAIIGNQSAISYKDTFPLLKENRVWMGASIHSGDREFRVPDNYPLLASSYRIDEKGHKFIRVKGVRWYTNIEHGRRHDPLSLMSLNDNLRYSKHKDLKEKNYAQKYENYDAIEIPYSDAIPNDYQGVMGVPITFMDKYCPEQFDIIYVCASHGKSPRNIENESPYINGKWVYNRILIKYTEAWIEAHPDDFRRKK